MFSSTVFLFLLTFFGFAAFFGFATNAAAQPPVILVQTPPELRIAFMLITCVMCLLAATMEIKERRKGASKESRVSFMARSTALILTGIGYVAGAYMVFIHIP